MRRRDQFNLTIFICGAWLLLSWLWKLFVPDASGSQVDRNAHETGSRDPVSPSVVSAQARFHPVPPPNAGSLGSMPLAPVQPSWMTRVNELEVRREDVLQNLVNFRDAGDETSCTNTALVAFRLVTNTPWQEMNTLSADLLASMTAADKPTKFVSVDSPSFIEMLRASGPGRFLCWVSIEPANLTDCANHCFVVVKQNSGRLGKFWVIHSYYNQARASQLNPTPLPLTTGNYLRGEDLGEPDFLEGVLQVANDVTYYIS